ncbi:MAG: spore cortex biosynthesis protein YabQ [Clostridia bacterium]|nr:spore cortex biosynthesis protein YabQ [Clostridia bacterium]
MPLFISKIRPAKSASGCSVNKVQIDYSLHTRLALWSVALGAVLCAVYDIFRLFRLRKKQNAVLLFVCDVAFCVIAAVSVLLLFFNLSFGRMRAYSFVLIAVGFAAWRLTVSRFVIAMMQKLIAFTERLINSIITRAKAKLKLVARKIYTKHYCKKTESLAKAGFGMKLKRKEIKNAEENNSPQ